MDVTPPKGWLRPSRVLIGLDVMTVEDLSRAVAIAVAGDVGDEVGRVQVAVREAFRRDGQSIGGGVALPQVELPTVARPIGCLAVLTRPLPLAASDGVAPDVFFFVLARPDDASGRLQLLTHVARLTQSAPLVQGLRQARTRDHAMGLVHAGEPRPLTPAPSTPAPTRALVVAAIAGERAVDALLVRLLDLGLDDAVIFEAQSAGEATAREVPLFAGFRDIFGDPGGRRVVLVEVDPDRVQYVVAAVRESCAEHDVVEAWLCAVPVFTWWRTDPLVEEATAEGH